MTEIDKNIPGSKIASPLERAGIWVANCLLQHINTLDVSDKKTPHGSARWKGLGSRNIKVASVAASVIAAAGLLAYGVAEQAKPKNLRRVDFKPPLVSVGPEEKSPFLLKTLDRVGSYATFPYGVIINQTPGLMFQVDSKGLTSLVEATNLVPPDGSIVSIVVGDEAESPFIGLDDRLNFEIEQRKIVYVGVTKTLSIKDSQITSDNRSLDALNSVNDVRLTIKWLIAMKQGVGVLARGNGGDNTLNSNELQAIIQQSPLPFKVITVPAN